MKELRHAVYMPAALQVREATEGEAPSRTITGYAVLFDTPSVPFYEDEKETVREVIARSAVTLDDLNACDIKMTMFHDRQLILARSNEGKGTLSYGVDEKGVYFEFEAPKTIDGDKALELVRRGDLAGCSFAFSTYYNDPEYVEESAETDNGHVLRTYTVKRVTGIYDFTIASGPAYPATSVEARELLRAVSPVEVKPVNNKASVQVQEMRDTVTVLKKNF